jgi:hypothetical protein
MSLVATWLVTVMTTTTSTSHHLLSIAKFPVIDFDLKALIIPSQIIIAYSGVVTHTRKLLIKIISVVN